MYSIKISISLVIALFNFSFCFTQDEEQDRMPNINDIQGIWVLKDDYVYSYIYVKKKKSIQLTFWDDDEKSCYITTKPYGYIGFINDGYKDPPINIKNLGTEGRYAVQYFYPTDNNGNFTDTPLVRQFTYNGSGTDGEMSKEEGDPNFMGFVNGRGQWEMYFQIPYIPTHVLVALKNNNPKDFDFLIEFLNLDYKTIQSPKATIYSAPNQPTKMYLIKGDEVECLEEKDDWYKIRYYGKKTIEGWVKKADVAL